MTDVQIQIHRNGQDAVVVDVRGCTIAELHGPAMGPVLDEAARFVNQPALAFDGLERSIALDSSGRELNAAEVADQPEQVADWVHRVRLRRYL